MNKTLSTSKRPFISSTTAAARHRASTRLSRVVSCTLLLSFMFTGPDLFADTTIINASIRNNSSQTVNVTITGFQQGSAQQKMAPGTSWNVSMKSNDNGLAIVAKGPKNEIKSRVGNGGSRTMANDRRPQFILWDR